MKYLLIIALLSIFLIAACTNNGPVSGSVVADVKQGCNDNNKCTSDFEDVNGQCNYKSMPNCCGNKVCEAGEGCNSATQSTSCSQDCEVCPADVTITATGCEGDCIAAADESLRVSGDSTLVFEVENAGEESIKLTPKFSCTRGAGEVKLSYYGLSENGFFEDSTDEIELSGKSKVNYKVRLTGKPNTSLNLDCNVYMNSGSKLFLGFAFLKLEA